MVGVVLGGRNVGKRSLQGKRGTWKEEEGDEDSVYSTFSVTSYFYDPAYEHLT